MNSNESHDKIKLFYYEYRVNTNLQSCCLANFNLCFVFQFLFMFFSCDFHLITIFFIESVLKLMPFTQTKWMQLSRVLNINTFHWRKSCDKEDWNGELFIYSLVDACIQRESLYLTCKFQCEKESIGKKKRIA